MSWNFTLSGETLDRVIFEIGNVRIAKKTSSGIVSIDPTANFQEHFDISRSDPATLIIYNATEADEAVFACIVETDIKSWTDEIEVQIVGKSMKACWYLNFYIMLMTYLCCIFCMNERADKTIVHAHDSL